MTVVPIWFLGQIMKVTGTHPRKMAQIVLSSMFFMKSSFYNSALLYILIHLYSSLPRGIFKLDEILYLAISLKIIFLEDWSMLIISRNFFIVEVHPNYLSSSLLSIEINIFALNFSKYSPNSQRKQGILKSSYSNHNKSRRKYYKRGTSSLHLKMPIL